MTKDYFSSSANQETIVELISFFQRALPEEFLSNGGSPTPTAWHTPQQKGMMVSSLIPRLHSFLHMAWE